MARLEHEMRRRKQLRLTAFECEALNQSPEGASSLTQPLGWRQGSQDVHRGLYPTYRTKKHPRVSVRGVGHQSSITDYFRSRPQPPRCAAVVAKDIECKREVDFLESFFARNDFLDPEESCSAVGDGGDPALMASRKRPRFPKSPNNLGAGSDQWDQDEKPPLGQRSEQPWADGSLKPDANDFDIDPLPDACFGLLGTPCWDVPRGNIEQLPDEVLREIFALVPAAHLFQSLTLVSHRFHRIISDPQFVPWKKLYYKYLKSETQAQLIVKAILQRYDLTPKQSYFPLGFLRCVASAKSHRCWDPRAIRQCLTKHSLFPKAEACLASWLPELSSPNAGPPYIWAIFATIVLISGGVSDVQELVASVRRPSSSLSLVDIMEVLYCMATLLFAMRDKKIHISNRFHYSIFYCLYLLENSSNGTTFVEPEWGSSVYERCPHCSNPDTRLTYEQQTILNHAIAPGEVMKIIAFAGTGKTSTLIRYAEKWSQLRFLYLAFNRTIADQAAQRFPPNVTCKTVHSLAFKEVGKNYKKKLNAGSLSSYCVSFVLRNREGQSLYTRAKTVIETLSAFFASADESISTEHTPLWCKNNQGQLVLVQEAEKRIIVGEANQIWENMKKLGPVREMAYKMTHDGYLKLWQLQKPSLSHYDAIFVDEAQDCTPAIMDIVLSQSCGAILVGDPHQQIYSFRGAVNALAEVSHTHMFYLTKSFRFGSEIAYVAATLLDVLKKVRKQTLVGGSQEGDITGADVTGKVTRLSRCNQTVFEDAVKLTNGEPPDKIHILGGLKAFGLEKIHDIWKLLHPELKLEVMDPFIKKWVDKGFAGLKDYAAKSEDKQLEMKIAIVEKYKDRIPELVERIEQCHESIPEIADHVLGTVHKAKGLEFDTVQVADDFTSSISLTVMQQAFERIPILRTSATSEDEWNLLYVAVTRAKRRLIVPKLLTQILTLAGEHYFQPVLTSEVCKEAEIRCSGQGCHNVISKDTVLTMKKMPFVYSDGTREPDGFLCDTCVQHRLALTWPTTAFRAAQAADGDAEISEVPETINILFERF
ncbi:F-box DNA helicase 1 isoform X1 [Podarcis lilfordi]|uniref:F-box DNA helicase 1 isoform X1 n=2 Tax=Podarcis lilfordi TaxID=74358 RepID=A0AA35PID6_9SAUR|nr:F-box DNA helicase 1 isoform X1 [Podarcis lilfordi]